MKKTKTGRTERRTKGPLDLDQRVAGLLFAQEKKVFSVRSKDETPKAGSDEGTFPGTEERDPYEENPGDDEPGEGS